MIQSSVVEMAFKTEMIIILVLVILYSSAVTAVNVSDCVTSPAGRVTLDVVGVPGPEGPKGDQGGIGIQGVKGDSGEKGMKGARGYPGERGPVGVPGHSGLTGEQGHTGDRGQKGQKGEIGAIGQSGLPGAIGPRGYPGDTVLSEEEFSKVTKTVQMNISSQLNDINTFIKDIKSTFTKCGIYSSNWRRVTYIDTTQGTTCPAGLREVTNSALNKRACGRTVDVGCSSLTFPSGGSYTHVCGRAQGYRFHTTDGFGYRNNRGVFTINNAYVDGLSITRGSPRKHVWTYAAGEGGCRCSQTSAEPAFVGKDSYCEWGDTTKRGNRLAWEDPLWDGERCTNCCQGPWFHKEVPPTTDNIEVRWCCDQNKGDEDFYTDIVEIWVL